MDLLFERFLSEERGEWPDIDLDLPTGDRRERVIQHVYEKYGRHGAGMTANVITYRDRTAAREVGKALGYSPEQVDRLSKQLARLELRRVPGADRGARRARSRRPGSIPRTSASRHFLRLLLQIQNLPRHLGQHSGGMVVAAGRLDEVVPLEPAAMPGRVVVQWDKDDCADLGIVKVDLLGLGMMAALEEAIPMIREQREGRRSTSRTCRRTIRPSTRCCTRPTRSASSRSRAARRWRRCRGNAPKRSTTSSCRWRSSGRGRSSAAWCIPSSTAGGAGAGRVPASVPRADPRAHARRAALPGAAAAHRDGRGGLHRRRGRGAAPRDGLQAIGRADDGDRGAAARRDGARGIGAAAQEQIVKSITSFALYGFPESHAASFALIAYASAYLKVHHPAAFYTALLNAQPMGFYHPATLVKDAQRHGVEVLADRRGALGLEVPVGERARVRLGLRFVQGLRRRRAERIEEEQAAIAVRGRRRISRGACALRADELDAARSGRGARRLRADAARGALAGREGRAAGGTAARPELPAEIRRRFRR